MQIKLDPSIRYLALSRLRKRDNQQCLPACKFCWSVLIYKEKCPKIGETTIKNLKFSDAKNTRKIDAFFSKQKSSETWELEVNEQSENRPSSSDTVINFVEQSESRPSASIASAKKQITHVFESEI